MGKAYAIDEHHVLRVVPRLDKRNPHVNGWTVQIRGPVGARNITDEELAYALPHTFEDLNGAVRGEAAAAFRLFHEIIRQIQFDVEEL